MNPQKLETGCVIFLLLFYEVGGLVDVSMFWI